MSFFENTRKPTGFGGKVMLNMMNLFHAPLADWGMKFLPLSSNAKVLDCGCGRRGQYPEAAEKMPAGCGEGRRLFARQRGKGTQAQRSGNR